MARRSRLSDRRIINDINATVGFLQNQSAVEARKIGIIGFCMGGRVVYLMAAANPAFKAAVAYYAGNIFRAWGRDIPSPFERPRKFIVRSKVTSARTMQSSPEDMAKLDAELSKLQKPHEFHSYPNAGHGLWTTRKKAIAAMPTKLPGRELWNFRPAPDASDNNWQQSPPDFRAHRKFLFESRQSGR